MDRGEPFRSVCDMLGPMLWGCTKAYAPSPACIKLSHQLCRIFSEDGQSMLRGRDHGVRVPSGG